MATKRLIDANALLQKFCVKCNAIYSDQPCEPSECIFYEMVKNAPTVDAVEVVHSNWDTVFYERNGTLATYSHLCPECKYFYRDVRFKGHNYCPNCGAKMDGDGNGTLD